MKKVFQVTVVLFLSVMNLFAQNGFIDLNFGTHGGFTLEQQQTAYPEIWFRKILDFDNGVYVISHKRDWKVNLYKYDYNGVLDTSFGNNGSVHLKDYAHSGTHVYGHSKGLLTVDGNDKVTFVSSVSIIQDDSDSRALVTKLNPDGSFDTGYGTNGKFISELEYGLQIIEAMLTGKDEIIVVGHNVSLPSDHSQKIYILKIDSTGQLDEDFGNEGIVEVEYDYENYIPTTAVISEESIHLLFHSEEDSDYIVKYDLNTLDYDSSFGVNGKSETYNFPHYASTQTFTIDTDGTIYSTGSYYSGNDLEYPLFISKHDHTGTLDTSFGTNGIQSIVIANNPESVTNSHSIECNDNKILIMGTTLTWGDSGGQVLQNEINPDGNFSKVFFAQFDKNGVLDDSFGLNGKIINHFFFEANLAYDYITQVDGFITCGTCPFEGDPQIPCLVKYLKSASLQGSEFEYQEILIYPNPVAETLFLTADEQVLRVDFYDISGKLVKTIQENTTQLDVSDLNPGTYLIDIKTQAKQQTIKFLKI